MFQFEQVLRQLVANSNSCIFVTDQAGRLAMVSPPARQFFNDSACQVEGQPIEQCICNASLLNAYTNAEAALSRGQITFQELAPWGEANNQFALRFQANKVVEADGVFLGCIYTFSVEKSDQQLEFEAIMLTNLMRYCEDLIYFKDLDSKFTRISDSMVEQLGGESVEAILGKTDFDFWEPKCAEGFRSDEQEIIQTGKSLTSKPERTDRAGEKTAWVLTTKMPLRDENNNIVGTFGISKDITSQKETELELESTHKQLMDASRQAGMAEIATNVIHNVGNVLNSINVSISQAADISRGLKIENLKKIADMLLANIDDPKFLTENEKGKRIPEYLSLVADELETNRSTIQEELESTQCHLQHVKMIVSMQQEYATANRVVEQVDLAAVLEDAIKMSSGSLERHRITLVRDFEPGIEIMLDKHRVMQILVNLIRNGKHAVQDTNQDKRMLKIAVVQPDSQSVSIEITDNGVGISPDNMLKLFNHGFSTKSNGHGFGLHSGANSAKELGGSLTAHSDGLGKGATFKLTLPLETNDIVAADAAPILHTDAGSNIFGSPSATV
jgi:PAS domain S-box-containing protein